MCPFPTQKLSISPCEDSQKSPVSATSSPIRTALQRAALSLASKESIHASVAERERHLRAYHELLDFYASTDPIKALQALHAKFAALPAKQQTVALLSHTHCQLLMRAWLKNLEQLKLQQMQIEQTLLTAKRQQSQLVMTQAEHAVQRQWSQITPSQQSDVKPSWLARITDVLRRLVGLPSRLGSRLTTALQGQYQRIAALVPPLVILKPPATVKPVKLSWWQRCKSFFSKKIKISQDCNVPSHPSVAPVIATPLSPLFTDPVKKRLRALMAKRNASMAQRLSTLQALKKAKDQIAVLLAENVTASVARRWWRSCASLGLATRLTRKIAALEQLRDSQKSQYFKLKQELLVKTAVCEFSAVLSETNHSERQVYFAAKCLAALHCANDAQSGLRARVPQAWLEGETEGALLQKIHAVFEQGVSIPSAVQDSTVLRDYHALVLGADSWQDRQQAERDFCAAHLAACQRVCTINGDDSTALTALINSQLAIQQVLKPYQHSLVEWDKPVATERQGYHWQCLMDAKVHFLKATKNEREHEGQFFVSVLDLYQATYGSIQAEKILTDVSADVRAELAVCAERSLSHRQLFEVNCQWNQLPLVDVSKMNAMDDPVVAFRAIVVPELKPNDAMLQHYLQHSLDDYHKTTKLHHKKHAALIVFFRQHNLSIPLNARQVLSMQALRTAFPEVATLPYHALKAAVAEFSGFDVSSKAQLEQKMVNLWEAQWSRGQGPLSKLPLSALMRVVVHLHQALLTLTPSQLLDPVWLPLLEQKLCLEPILILRIRLLLTETQVSQYLLQLTGSKSSHTARKNSTLLTLPANDTTQSQLLTFVAFIKKHGGSESQQALEKLQAGYAVNVAVGRSSGMVHEIHAYNILIRAIGQFIVALSKYQPNANQARVLTVKKLLQCCQQVTSQIEHLAKDPLNDPAAVMHKKLCAFDTLIGMVAMEMHAISKEYSFFNPSSSVLFSVLSNQSLLLTHAKDNYQLQGAAKKTSQQCLARLVTTLKTCSEALIEPVAKDSNPIHCLNSFEQGFNRDAEWLLQHYLDIGSNLTILRASLGDYFHHWQQHSSAIHAMHYSSSVIDQQALTIFVAKKTLLNHSMLSFCWLLKQLSVLDKIFFKEIEDAVAHFLRQQSLVFEKIWLPEMTSDGNVFNGNCSGVDNNLSADRRKLQNAVLILTYMAHKTASVFQSLADYRVPPTPASIITIADLRLTALKSEFIWRGATGYALAKERCSRYSTFEAFANFSVALIGFNKTVFLNKDRQQDRSEFQRLQVTELLTEHYLNRVRDWVYRVENSMPHFREQFVGSWFDTIFDVQDSGCFKKNSMDQRLENPNHLKKLQNIIDVLLRNFPHGLAKPLQVDLQQCHAELSAILNFLVPGDLAVLQKKLRARLMAAGLHGEEWLVCDKVLAGYPLNSTQLVSADNRVEKNIEKEWAALMMEVAIANKKLFVLALFNKLEHTDIHVGCALVRCALGHLKALLNANLNVTLICQDALFVDQLLSSFEVLISAQRYELLNFIREHAILNELIRGLKRQGKESEAQLTRWLTIVNCLHSVVIFQDVQTQVALTNSAKMHSYSVMRIRAKEAQTGLLGLKTIKNQAVGFTLSMRTYLTKVVACYDQFHFLGHLHYLQSQLAESLQPLIDYEHFKQLQDFFKLGNHAALVSVAEQWQQQSDTCNQKKGFKLMTTLDVMAKVSGIAQMLTKPLMEINIEELVRDVITLPSFIKRQHAELATKVNLGRVVNGEFANQLHKVFERCKLIVNSIYTDGKVYVLVDATLHYFEKMLRELSANYSATVMAKGTEKNIAQQQDWFEAFEQLFLAYHLGFNPHELPLKLKTEVIELGFARLFAILPNERTAQIRQRLYDIKTEEVVQCDRESTESLLNYVQEPRIKQSIAAMVLR